MFKFLLGLGAGVAGTLGVLYVRNRILVAKAQTILPPSQQPYVPPSGGIVDTAAAGAAYRASN